MFCFIPIVIIAQSTTINNMFGLLSYIGFMWLKVKFVSATAKLIGSVIFNIDTAIV